MHASFRLLGPVEIHADQGLAVHLPPRQLGVLAYLLLHAHAEVSLDRLITAMWGQDPPVTARSQLHGAMTGIRRTLREAGVTDLITTGVSGYMVAPAPHGLDLSAFTAEAAAARAETDPAAAAGRLRAALSLWRGPAFAGLRCAYVPAARERLTERRLAAVEQLAELDLSFGRERELADRLTAEVAAHPLRQRLAGQLMLALHRAGRQSDALAVARELRRALSEEQGLDPGHEFTTLEQAIRRDEPALTAIARSRPSGFLPLAVPDFAGRAAELAALTRLSEQHIQIIAIDGMPGVGKTTLAVRAARGLAPEYPDGQIYLDLQGHTENRPPLPPEAALSALLRQLGVEADPGALAATWRAELDRRRVLILLDNAADAAQVRPLLPGTPGSLTLITARRRLTDLDGAIPLSLDPLPTHEAVALFTGIAGDRATAAPDLTLEVVDLCGRLPLAVRLAATRLQHRPQWTMAHLAGRLRGQHRLLTELRTPERGVTAAFTLSHLRLKPAEARMFRLLSALPGADLNSHAAAALADVPPHDAEDQLEGLLDAHMLTQARHCRYGFHDLMREYAHRLATEDERNVALERLLGHYLDTTRRATGLLYPGPGAGTTPFFADAEGAQAWLDEERANLLAAVARAADHGLPAFATGLAFALRRHLDSHGHHADALTVHGHALRAAGDDPVGAAQAHLDLGWARHRQGRFDLARDHYRRATGLFATAGDRQGEGRARNGLGNVHRRLGEPAEARAQFEQALTLAVETGQPMGEAVCLGGLGTVLAMEERLQEAADHYERARKIFAELGDNTGVATSLQNLGLVAQQDGDTALALRQHIRAQDLYRDLGDLRGEAEATNSLGDLARTGGEYALALRHYTTAVALATEADSSVEQAHAHAGAARAMRALGQDAAARVHGRRALDLYTELGLPEVEEARAFVAGLTSSRPR